MASPASLNIAKYYDYLQMPYASHLRANVAKNQTFSKYCGNSSKINPAHILMLGRP